jgi:hypothetical protein
MTDPAKIDTRLDPTVVSPVYMDQIGSLSLEVLSGLSRILTLLTACGLISVDGLE